MKFVGERWRAHTKDTKPLLTNVISLRLLLCTKPLIDDTEIVVVIIVKKQILM